MKRNIIGIFVMMLLIGTSLSVVGSMDDYETDFVDIKEIRDLNVGGGCFDDQLDQQQKIVEHWDCISPDINRYLQSFTPSLNTLTKIELLLKVTGDFDGAALYEVYITEHIDTPPLAFAYKLFNNKIGPTWVEFDFDDIYVQPGLPYWIEVRMGCRDPGMACWGFARSDPYPLGYIVWWDFYNTRWRAFFEEDFCFKTYGHVEVGNLPPHVSIINPSDGDTVEGTVTITGSAHDPNGDWEIDWVYVSIDSSGWLEAVYDSSTGNWSYNWDSTTVEDGEHIISAITSDGSIQSAVSTVVCNVSNEPEPEKKPDLECSGTLSWSDVKPGVTVTGSCTVSNVGDHESLLDWKVEDVPGWGTWTCSPDEEYDLTPAVGATTVLVSVIAPDEQEKDYSGHITIINMENASDYEIIDVSLSTPKTKALNTIFLTFLENHPRLFPLIRQILKL